MSVPRKRRRGTVGPSAFWAGWVGSAGRCPSRRVRRARLAALRGPWAGGCHPACRAVAAALFAVVLLSCGARPPDRATLRSAPTPEPPGTTAAERRFAAEIAAAQEGVVAEFARYVAEDVVIDDAWGCGPVRGREQLVQRLAVHRGATFEEVDVESAYGWAHSCFGASFVDPLLFYPIVVLDGGPTIDELWTLSP
jgi:hypothetical protein